MSDVFEEERQKLHFSTLCSTFPPILLSPPWCHSLRRNVSASGVSRTVWSPYSSCAPSRPLPLHSLSSPSTMGWTSWILSGHIFDHFQDLCFSLGQNLEEVWESLIPELSGPAKGHSPDHLGWLWTEPAASQLAALFVEGKVKRNIVFLSLW